MNTKKPILIVAAEPFSVFSEILFKTFKKHKLKRPLVVLASYKIFKKQMNYLKYNLSFNIIDEKFHRKNLKINRINLINIDFDSSQPFKKISNISNSYIRKSFKIALSLIKKKKILGLINGPISKTHFLKNKYLGITEYLAKKTQTSDFAMLIYNENLAVSPITTHVPLRKVSKLISKKKIINHAKLIMKFYKDELNIKPKIAITGLNPHCESNRINNEEKKIIIPAIKHLIKTFPNISGPYPADSLFMTNNIKNFDVVIGMYHDQVLTPLKSVYNFNAINITLGLPFIRITPDHGPNSKMIGKNNSDPNSLISAIKFFEKK